jgi:hypothetical protein
MLFENLQMLFGHLKPIPKFREHAVPDPGLTRKGPSSTPHGAPVYAAGIS